MTSEKDREEARYKNLARNIRQFILSAEEKYEHGIGCIECWDLYYEAEIIEILKSFRSEAVKAERELCAERADTELKRQGFRKGEGSTRALVSDAILSPDQGTDEKETDRG